MDVFNKFDISKIQPKSTSERKSLLNIEDISLIDPQSGCFLGQISTLDDPLVAEVVLKIKMAKELEKPIILCTGAHTIKNGCGTIINSLIEHGFITHIASNGATAIHDTEFGMFGSSTESVRENLKDGSFGIWKEIGAAFNEALSIAEFEDRPFGNALGQMAVSHVNPYREYTIGYGAFHYNIPYTVHPCLGQDITFEYPHLNWGLLGSVGKSDFLYFAESIRNLSGGVYLSIGSSVMSPMIFEKALSMSRHVEQREGRDVTDFTIAVNDIVPKSGFDWSSGKEPPMSDPEYYMRFLKSFNRSGGDVKYICADNRRFLYSLWKNLVE